MLIDKHNLQYEHVKQVNVVHPSGKKFMGLILEIIQIAIKDVLHKKYRNAEYEKSLDIDAAVAATKKITQVENDLQKMLNEDVKKIKERSHEIQVILSKIMTHEEITDYERFVTKWLEFLKTQSKAIEQRNVKIDEIVTKAHQLFKDAQEMMSKKEFKLEAFPNESFQNTSASFLIESLKKTLPVIKNFIVEYPVNDVAVTEEEKRIVAQKLKELEQMDTIVENLTEKCKTLQITCAKLQTMNEERQLLDNNDTMCDENDNWKLSAFTESSCNFEASKNCTASVNLKGFNQLALLDENDNILRAPSSFNRTLEMNVVVDNTFKVPPKQPSLPSRRRKRRDPMELLDKATSSNPRGGNQSFMPLDNSIMMPFKSHTSTPLPPLSSTMLSPDFHQNNLMLNFSSVSEISVMSLPRPHVESAIDKTLDYAPVKNPMDDITNSMPKITIVDATLEATLRNEETIVVEKENFGTELSTLLKRKSIADEDLFNVSDTCLEELPDE